jgi:hypothetical protein
MIVVFSVGAGGLLVLAILLIVLCLGGGSEPEDTSGPGVATLNPMQKRVREATQKGVAYLKERLRGGDKLYAVGDPRGGGAHPGAVALAGLTLLECGVSPDDPALQQALITVRGQANTMSFTYAIAASILFLDRLNNGKDRAADPRDQEFIRSLGLRLIAGQNNKGGWAYHCQPLSPQQATQLLGMLQGGRFVPGSFRVPGQMTGYDDNSIGQFATLALWAARKHGLPVRASLQAVGQRYRAKQNADGSWNYHDRNPFLRDTSTCAGLIGLAVAHGIEDEEQPAKAGAPKVAHAPLTDIAKDPAVEKGLRYLGGVVGKVPAVDPAERERRHKHTATMEDALRRLETAAPQERQQLIQQLIQLDKAPLLRGIYFDGDNWGDLYFLWSLERMAVIYDLKRVGEKDWYAWGSEIILDAQSSDGSWRERFPGVPDTCFALLFLMRANIVKDLTDKLRQARRAVVPGAPPPGAPQNPPPGKKD